MKPEMWSREKFELYSYFGPLNEHHGTEFKNWNDFFGGETWKRFNDTESYNYYKRWYVSQFTKLGKALK